MRGRDVDVVVADRDVGDHLQPGGGPEHLGVDRVRDLAHQPLLVLQPGYQLGLGQRIVAGVEIDLRPRAGEFDRLSK